VLSDSRKLWGRTTAPAYNIHVIIVGMWTVSWHKDADLKLHKLPVPERVAMLHAVDKPKASGRGCPTHTKAASAVSKGAASYARAVAAAAGGRSTSANGDAFVIGAVGPEAQVDQRGFDKAARDALARLERQQ